MGLMIYRCLHAESRKCDKKAYFTLWAESRFGLRNDMLSQSIFVKTLDASVFIDLVMAVGAHVK